MNISLERLAQIEPVLEQLEYIVSQLESDEPSIRLDSYIFKVIEQVNDICTKTEPIMGFKSSYLQPEIHLCINKIFRDHYLSPVNLRLLKLEKRLTDYAYKVINRVPRSI